MLLFVLPSSSGAVVGHPHAAHIVRPATKPRILYCALKLQEGLRTALEGQVHRNDSLSTFYLN